MTNINSNLDIILNFIKTGKGAEDAEKAVGDLKKTTDSAEGTTKKFNLAQTAASLGLAAVTLNAVKQIPQMAQLGFKYDNAKIALEAYAGSAEVATDITDAITEAAGFAIDKFTAVESATRLLSLGLVKNAEEAAKFTKIAVTLGATMGKDVQGSFEEFSLLLANESILRLDTYGISGAKVREEMARLAAVFPEMDRNARFTNATLSIGGEKLAQLEAAGFKAVSSIDVMAAGFENLKLEAAGFVADGVVPVADGIVGMGNAADDANVRLAEGADSFAEYEKAAKQANSALGADVIGRLALSTSRLTKAEFEAVKATQELAEAQEDLVVVEEEVILTAGGINELLQEQAFLSKALSLGIGGTLTKAMDKYTEGLNKNAEKSEDLKEAARGLVEEMEANEQAVIDAGIAYNAAFQPSQKYLNSMESLRIKQEELNKKLEDGDITLRKHTNETNKIIQSQSDLDGALGDSDTAYQDYIDTLVELDDQQEDLQEQLQELGVDYREVGEENDKLAESLKRATAELIFQSAAAELDANTSLLLARELGLVDEATFAVAQEAQRLRIQYDEGAISAQQFAGDAGRLAESVGELQSKSIDINVNTINAEVSTARLEDRLRRVRDLSLVIRTQTTGELAGVRPGLQEGGQFRIPDSGPFGDVNPVSFMAERGETVTVTPRDGSSPAGTGGVNIGVVNLGSSLDLAFFTETMERIR